MLTEAKKQAKRDAKRNRCTLDDLCPRAGGCSCHQRQLNPWVPRCPRCGCENPRFVEGVEPPDWSKLFIPY